MGDIPTWLVVIVYLLAGLFCAVFVNITIIKKTGEGSDYTLFLIPFWLPLFVIGVVVLLADVYEAICLGLAGKQAEE